MMKWWLLYYPKGEVRGQFCFKFTIIQYRSRSEEYVFVLAVFVFDAYLLNSCKIFITYYMSRHRHGCKLIQVSWSSWALQSVILLISYMTELNICSIGPNPASPNNWKFSTWLYWESNRLNCGHYSAKFTYVGWGIGKNCAQHKLKQNTKLFQNPGNSADFSLSPPHWIYLADNRWHSIQLKNRIEDTV